MIMEWKHSLIEPKKRDCRNILCCTKERPENIFIYLYTYELVLTSNTEAVISCMDDKCTVPMSCKIYEGE